MTPKADSIEWLDLEAGEDLRWSGRPTVSPVAPFLVIGVGIAAFGVFVAALLIAPSSPFRFVLIGLFIGLGLFVVGWRSAEQRSVAYAITTDAVYEKSGIAASPDISTIPLSAIESTSEERSTLAGLAGRGTIRIYAPTTDRTTLTLDGISDPEEVRALLSGHPDTTSTSSGATETGTETADAGPKTTNAGHDRTSFETAGTDTDTTGTDPVIDGREEASETLRAYVVDATDDAVLLRAFMSTDADTNVDTTDLERGRAVSLTLRSGLDPEPGSKPDPESTVQPTLDRISTTDSESPADSDTFEGRRSDRDNRMSREGGTDENHENDPDEQFVWGDTSSGEDDERRPTTGTDDSPGDSDAEADRDDWP